MDRIAHPRSVIALAIVALLAGSRAHADDPQTAVPQTAVPQTAVPQTAVPQAATQPETPLRNANANDAPPNDEAHPKKVALDDLDPAEWIHQLAAPSVMGPSGLVHVIDAEAVPLHTVRAGVVFEGFRASPFLFTTPRDDDFRLTHALSVIAGGPNITFLRQSELYLTLGGVYNRELRTDPGRTDPSATSAVGNVLFGIKSGWALSGGFSVGARLGLRFWNSPSGMRVKPDALAGLLDGLVTWDFLKWRGVPLRFSLNLSGQVDNSDTYLTTVPCASSSTLDACVRSRAAQAFAYGLSQSQMRLAVGLEIPMRFGKPGGHFGLSVLAEYMGTVVVSSGDPVMTRTLAGTGAGLDDLGKRMSHLVTGAVRLRPGARFVVDLGADVGLASQSLRFGSKLPPWQARLGVSYSYDFDSWRAVDAVPGPEIESLQVIEAPPALPATAPEQPESLPTAAELAFAKTPIACLPAASAPVCEAAPVCPPAAVCAPAPKCEAPPTCEELAAKVERKGKHPKSKPSDAGVSEAAPEKSSGKTAATDSRARVAQPPDSETAAQPEVKKKRRPHIKHEGVLLGVDDPIFFVGNKALVPHDSLRVLADVALYVKASTNIVVTLSALTDNEGVSRTGKLARDRVKAVTKYLVSQGVPESIIHTRGFGETPPSAPANPTTPPIELRIFVSMSTTQ